MVRAIVCVCMPCCFVIFNFLVSITSFNIDTKHPIFFDSEAKDYFGYSVALLKNQKDKYCALISAPKANSTVLSRLYQPGVLYKCKISLSSSNQTCTEVLLDERENTEMRHRNFIFKPRKDRMFLGASLDVQQSSRNNKVVICGHLWKSQCHTNDYCVIGICYIINAEFEFSTVKTLLPILYYERGRQTFYRVRAQVGTSAAFSEDGKYLFLGAPSYRHFEGTVITFNATQDMGLQDPDVVKIIKSEKLSQEIYIGYSVTSGTFFGNSTLYTAVGAPRANNTCGQVHVFESMGMSDTRIVLEGHQLGEYFGASVLGVTMKKNSFSYLLVGAPFYTYSNGDEGRVYVYTNNGKTLVESRILYGDKKAFARFGSCISNIGDINQDNWDDIAIGSPYEDNAGAVYIYHGASYGINYRCSQRIQASEFSRPLLGFGMSISRGLDIDNNQYPDILIGSYGSSSAVLLRSYPIIKIKAMLDFSLQQINANVLSCNFQGKNVSCFNVTSCLQYYGKHLQSNLTFKTRLYIDYNRQVNKPRSSLLFEQKPTYVIKRNVSVNVKNSQCFTDIAFIHHDAKDIFTSVDFLYAYELINNTGKEFCKVCPVIASNAFASNITKSISFQTGCKNDVCNSDLAVNATILGSPGNLPLIIGGDTSLVLIITVKNNGEASYASELLISLPPKIPIVTPGSLCSSNQQKYNATLLCELGNPLLTDKTKDVEIKINISNVAANTDFHSIFLETKTQSLDVDPSNDKMELIIPFKTSADIEIRGTHTNELIQYENKHTPLLISHTYIVSNHGPSPIDSVGIQLCVPSSYENKNGNGLINFVDHMSLERDNDRPLAIFTTCDFSEVQPIASDDAKSDEDIWGEDDIPSQKRSIRTFRSVMEGEDTEIDTRITAESVNDLNTHSTKKKNDYIIDCETAYSFPIHCTAEPFHDTRKYAKLTINIQLNVSHLDAIFDSWHQIEFYTTGKVFIWNDNGNIQPHPNRPDKTSVKTILLHPGPLPPEKVASWIIYVCVGLSILLLNIILIILIKIGFFKREQKEKMRNMMKQPDQTEHDPYLINNEFETNEEESLERTT